MNLRLLRCSIARRRFLLAPALWFCAAAAAAQNPRTLLFVDDHDILYRAGTKRLLHPAVKHAQNPVIPADKPWELTIAYNTVHRDPVSGRYQMWYQAATSRSPEASAVCYAESDDGVRWRKPALGLFPHGEIKETNIVLAPTAGRYCASVVFDPRDPDASRRYKLAHFEQIQRPDGTKPHGLAVAFSPDGIHWEKHPQSLLLRGSGGKSAAPPFAGDPVYDHASIAVAVADVIDVLHDPVRGVFAIYSKTWTDGPDGKMFWKRAVARTESKDFVTWSAPQLVMMPDEFDGSGVEYLPPVGKVHPNRRGVQLHSGPVFWHEGAYFSLLQVMDGETTGEMPSELAISRDGLNWQRPFRAKPFIDVTHRRADFDGGCIWSNSTPVVLEDEIRFYYGAYSGLWNGDLARSPTGIGLATVPRDRFAGVRPIETRGQITLKPIAVQAGASLTLNADASAGSVRAELLTESGYRVRDFTEADAVPIASDGLRHKLTWKNAGTPPAGSYLIRLHLEGAAEVFALTVN
ncbi:MAG: hypothetical protein EXS32_05550 [Opitutus sp.]|nr:hypothetical protein [Opitutus sp.]